MTAIVNLFAGPGGWEEGLGDHAGEDAAIARAEARELENQMEGSWKDWQ